MTDGLPDGWKRAPLGAFCEVSPRDDALRTTSPFVPMAAVSVGQRYPNFLEDKGSRGGVRARAGDVLFARITPCLENGKVAQIPQGLSATGGSTEFLVVRPGRDIDPGYLYYWCLTPAVRSQAKSKMSGATGRMRLSPQSLAGLEISVAPYAEQQRIVEILENHLSRLEAAEQSTSNATRRLAAYRRSTLSASLYRPGREAVPLGRLVDRIETGRSFGGSSPPSGEREWGVVKVSAMTWGEFRPDENKTVPASAIDPRHEIRQGDLLVSRANTSSYVGASVLVDSVRPRLLLSDKSLRLVPGKSVDPRWLWFVLSSPEVRTQISLLATGTKDSMRNISQARLLSVQVPLIPYPMQMLESAQLASHLDSERRLYAALNGASQRARALRRALLEAAFSGRLTGRASDMDRVEEMADV